jgi:hypothetical protein
MHSGATITIVTLLIAMASGPQDARFHLPHEPLHGGQFFVAARDTLHIEGVWPEQRRFKLFVADEWGRPLPEARLRELGGRIVVGDVSAPLAVAADAEYLEARLPTLKMPADLSLVLSVPGREDEGFQFSFHAYSDERNAVRYPIEPTVIPDSLPGILAALKVDGDDIDAVFSRGQLAFVYAPADRARDHVLALEAYLPGLAVAKRAQAEELIRTAVRAAWLLHVASDEGTLAQAHAARTGLSTAVAEVMVPFQGQRQ